MIIESLVWLTFTIFIVVISALKTKFFMKQKRFKNYIEALNKLKQISSPAKTLEDQKEYLRKKTEGGGDLVYIIVSMIIFLGGFVMLIYSKITNLNMGFLLAIAFSLIFAAVFSKVQFEGVIGEFKFIDSFIGFLFASTFMVYVKFIETGIPNILLLIISIGLMILINNKINKWVGNARTA